MLTSHELTVDLPPTSLAAAQARHASRCALLEWDLRAVLDDALLIVGELVGNCVRHGLPPYSLRLRHRARCLEIAVHDDGGGAPVLLDAAHDSTSGRGMLIVQALADTVEVVSVPGDGKLVVATLPV